MGHGNFVFFFFLNKKIYIRFGTHGSWQSCGVFFWIIYFFIFPIFLISFFILFFFIFVVFIFIFYYWQWQANIHLHTSWISPSIPPVVFVLSGWLFPQPKKRTFEYRIHWKVNIRRKRNIYEKLNDSVGSNKHSGEQY